jgi:hypothetical protein
MIFDISAFPNKGDLRAFLNKPETRAEAHASLRRFLSQGLYSAQGVAVRPPLFNKAEGFHGRGDTVGYISAAIAPGDVGGAAAGGEANQAPPLTYWVPIPGVDQQWKNIFSRRPSTSDGETYEGAAALFFWEEQKLGDKPKLAVITDTKTFLKNLKFAAAVSIYRDWLDDNKIWDINQVLTAGRRDGLRDQANRAYTAFKAASFATVTAADASWVKALNLGFAALKRAGTLTEGVTPLVVCSPEMAYIFVQLKHDRSSYLLTGNQLTDDFNVISTQYFAAAEPPRMVIPGEAMWWQDRQGLQQDQARDIFLDSDATTFDYRGNFLIYATKGLDADTGRFEVTASLKQGRKLAVTG